MTRRRIPYRTRTQYDAADIVLLLLGLWLIHCLCSLAL
jgi:hypothetical protein